MRQAETPNGLFTTALGATRGPVKPSMRGAVSTPSPSQLSFYEVDRNRYNSTEHE